jgi:hypothetical protein
MFTVHEDNLAFFLSYHAQFFLEWEMFQAEFVEEIKNHFVFNDLFSKIVPFMI